MKKLRAKLTAAFLLVGALLLGACSNSPEKLEPIQPRRQPIPALQDAFRAKCVYPAVQEGEDAVEAVLAARKAVRKCDRRRAGAVKAYDLVRSANK
jgi:hypothetical protein